ncbi:hypothetical protein LOD99_2261 [Oopsacas minuta]|uniref:Uncharacterized protein n=1 Tax=Oopsacas minuta TaxID=111878 RepID=A0AAV7K3C0_9METZ|nr:hypothetical protein LOD99_2261 [Oopsacas minuta]
MQKQMFIEYKWLKLNEDMETCHCAVCVWAIKNNRIQPIEKGNTRGTSKWVKTGDGEGWRSTKKGKSSLDRYMGENQPDYQKVWLVYQMEIIKPVIEDRFHRIKRGDIEFNDLSSVLDSVMTWGITRTRPT